MTGPLWTNDNNVIAMRGGKSQCARRIPARMNEGSKHRRWPMGLDGHPAGASLRRERLRPKSARANRMTGRHPTFISRSFAGLNLSLMPQKRLAAGVLPALACAALMTLSAKSDEPAPASAEHREYFRGMSDASAGVMPGTDCFAAGNDGDNRIRIYRLDSPGRPLDSFDCSGFLWVFGKNLETDPEGAARMGGRIFWFGSHGANQHGHFAPNRRRCARHPHGKNRSKTRPITPGARPGPVLVTMIPTNGPSPQAPGG